MAWEDPPTRSTGTLITSTIWNQDVVANTNWLFAPDSEITNYDEGSNPTTTGTSFTVIDTAGDPDLRSTFTTVGENVAVTFVGFANGSNTSGASGIYFNVFVDSVAAIADDGIQAYYNAAASGSPGDYFRVYFRLVIEGLSAGEHTFDVAWKVSAASGTTTATLFAGAGTTRLDTVPRLDVRKAA